MRLSNICSGIVRLEITSGDISGCLSAIAAADILVYDVVYNTDLSISVTADASDYRKIQLLTDKRGDDCKILCKSGLRFLLKHLYKRATILLAICVLMLLTVWIPRRILFLRVEGNHLVDTQAILLSAQENGIRFGCIRSELRSEEIKNKIIEDIPQLDWVGITTRGCVATVAVSEKKVNTEQTENTFPVSSIAASRDGIIDSISATRGTILCKAGSAVYEGQVLISGYEDCGRILKGTNAQGEVYAKTFYMTEAFSPRKYFARTQIIDCRTTWSLKIGKIFINFSKDSGISHPTCVKMYWQRYLTLPGGFQLPVCLIRQDVIVYDYQEEILSQWQGLWMSAAVEQYLKNQMVAGEILSGRDYSECMDDIFYMSSRYACREQIGIRKIEESWKDYGKDS